MGGTTDADDDGYDANFVYVKGGWLVDLFSVGKTAFSTDWQQTRDDAASGDTGNSSGLVGVQILEQFGTDFYAGVRTYDLDQDNAPGVSDILAFTTGTRVKFCCESLRC